MLLPPTDGKAGKKRHHGNQKNQQDRTQREPAR